MREKLIELLDDIQLCGKSYKLDGMLSFLPISNEIIADHLIADGVTIPVRCKDCKYGIIDDADFPNQYLCKHNGSDWNKGEHFCSYGERRTDEGKAD